MMITCKGCNGTYSPTLPDGTLYFHACPSTVASADRRDENVKSTAEKDFSLIKAAGKGIA